MTSRFLSPIDVSRRTFLAHSATVLAGAGVASAGIFAPQRILALPARSSRPALAFLPGGPDIVDPETLRRFARAAIDAATHAGADYADVRIGVRRVLNVTMFMMQPHAFVSFDASYGIRAKVGGAWAFVAGTDQSADGVTRTARAAAETAKGLKTLAIGRPDLAPTPVVTGEWRTPVRIDPFAVPIDDQIGLIAAYQSVGERMPHTSSNAGFEWSAEVRIFASSEGSLVTQHLAEASPWVTAAAEAYNIPNIDLRVPGFAPASAGFELVVKPDALERIKATAEEAQRLVSYPLAPAMVGRYDAVFDGQSFGAMFAATLAPSLELSRVLNEEADGAGTTFLAPVSDVLGRPLFSNALTVTSERDLPNLGAAKWDDEGVEVRPFPLIERGAVVDYFGTRVTTTALSSWYASRGGGGPKGCAVAWNMQRAPLGAAAGLRIAADPSGAQSPEALAKQISDGILVYALDNVNSDQQLTGALCLPRLVFEVKRGALTKRLTGAVLPISTKQFWKNLKSVGGPLSTDIDIARQYGGAPWAQKRAVTVAPAGLFTNVGVTTLPQGLQ